MEIKRIINNNVVQATQNGKEVMAQGIGIAFGRKVGDIIDDKTVMKIYELTNTYFYKHIQALTMQIPEEYWDFTYQMQELVETYLEKKLDINFYISLLDHIFVAVKRARNHLSLPGFFILEAKLYYKKEYEISKVIVKNMEEKFNITCDKNEAHYMVLHIVDALLEDGMTVMDVVVNIINDTLNVMKSDFHFILDEDSFQYARFINHLRFFSEKVVNEKKVNKSDSEKYTAIFDSLKKEYGEQYRCLLKITDNIFKKYKYVAASEEQFYLLLHIIKATVK